MLIYIVHNGRMGADVKSGTRSRRENKFRIGRWWQRSRVHRVSSGERGLPPAETALATETHLREVARKRACLFRTGKEKRATSMGVESVFGSRSSPIRAPDGSSRARLRALFPRLGVSVRRSGSANAHSHAFCDSGWHFGAPLTYFVVPPFHAKECLCTRIRTMQARRNPRTAREIIGPLGKNDDLKGVQYQFTHRALGALVDNVLPSLLPTDTRHRPLGRPHNNAVLPLPPVWRRPGLISPTFRG